MLALSPRAVERLESYTPPWPLAEAVPADLEGKLIEGVFRGETINTPSMLCVEDALELAEMGRVGRRPRRAGRPRGAQSGGASRAWVERSPWLRLSCRGPGDQLLHLDRS